MTDGDTSTSSKFISPRPVAGLRPLTGEEIECLAAALGKPVDRNYLAFWISQSISNAVKLSTLPSGRTCRDELMRVARQGRQWLRRIDECPSQPILGQGIEIDELKGKVAQFCAHAEAVARQVGGLIKRGQRPTSPALQAFLDVMIGIAKHAKVLPSTPQRYMNSRRPPAFFEFVEEALVIAREVIDSSRMAEQQRARALASLHIYSRDALIRLLERSRGRIGSYHVSAFGLVEDSSRAPATRQRRSRA